MELGHAYSVLVVSASAKFNESVRGLLPERFYWPVTVLTDAAGARRELLENSYDLVVINTPLPDEFGTRLAQDICQHSAAGVLLLVKAEHFPDIDGRLTPQGVLVLSKPMSTQLFTQSLRLLCGTRERLRGLEKKNATIEEKKAAIARLQSEISALKARRKTMSEALQERIFRLFVVNSGEGERRDLIDVFATFYQANPTLQASSIPPSGSGECCAPKLLQYAFNHQLKPLCIAEFWWGNSPAKEIRHHGHYYGACLGKCRPILSHMLRGVDIEPQQHEKRVATTDDMILYADSWIVVANKPAGMLTVPGRLHDNSLQTIISQEIGAPLKAVHRLDMSTSGIVILAKSDAVYAALQADFASRNIEKRYIALLDGMVIEKEGVIDLPLRPDINDRPRQMVDYEHGKRAITRYEVLSHTPDHRTRIAFYPLTGRTHQLRVHASHKSGLGCPIVGDMLYGHANTRLMLHAEVITFTHPISKENLTFKAPCPF